MSIDVSEILNRIKKLEYHNVTLELYQPIPFNGVVPFDINIKGDVATFKVLAEDYSQAEKMVLNFLKGLRDE